MQTIEPPPLEPIVATDQGPLHPTDPWDRWFRFVADLVPIVNRYETSLAPASVAANTTAEQTFTVTGLTTRDFVWVNKPTHQAGLGIAGCRVSAADTLAITYTNPTAGAIVPTTETYFIVTVRL